MTADTSTPAEPEMTPQQVSDYVDEAMSRYHRGQPPIYADQPSAERNSDEEEITPCVGCGDPDCDFDCDGPYDDDPEGDELSVTAN